MMANAFCPAHITGFFKAELDDSKRIENQGSLGAGFSLKNGVMTSVKIRKKTPQDGNKNFSISTSGYKTDNTEVSEFVLSQYLKLLSDEEFFTEIHHEITIPVGYGFGASGAAALSLAIALNKALNLDLTRNQVGKIAHQAEISCNTGLGDVLASYHGGFEIRIKSGAPGIGEVHKIKMKNPCIAMMICFSPISTKQFIKERMSAVNGLGGKFVNKLLKTKSRKDFLDMSIEFAKYVQVITPRMDAVINELHSNGISCGVALFGETVFTLIPKNLENKVFEILKNHGKIIIRSEIDNLGAR